MGSASAEQAEKTGALRSAQGANDSILVQQGVSDADVEMKESDEHRDMKVAQLVIDALVSSSVERLCYVADHILAPFVEAAAKDGSIEVLPVAREDEGLGILAGAYLGGQRGAMFMQSSGFALCANALGSLLIPYQIPVPMFIGLRGDIGEFNVAQMAGGQSVDPICRALGIPYWAPDTAGGLAAILAGALTTSFGVKGPVAVGIRRNIL